MDLVDLEGQHAGGEDFFMSKNKKKSKKKGSRMKKIITGISMGVKNNQCESVRDFPLILSECPSGSWTDRK